MQSIVYNGKKFNFYLFNEDKKLYIGLASDLVYPTVDKKELKELAEFILRYLDNN